MPGEVKDPVAAALDAEETEKFETLRIAQQRGLESLEHALKQRLDPNVITGGTIFSFPVWN